MKQIHERVAVTPMGVTDQSSGLPEHGSAQEQQRAEGGSVLSRKRLRPCAQSTVKAADSLDRLPPKRHTAAGPKGRQRVERALRRATLPAEHGGGEAASLAVASVFLEPQLRRGPVSARKKLTRAGAGLG